MSIHKRLDWLMTSTFLLPRLKPEADSAARRLPRPAASARYSMLFNFKPLIRCQLGTAPHELTDDVPVKHAIMALRLTTLMRSVNVAHVLWTLGTLEERAFVNIIHKTGQLRCGGITRGTSELIVQYIWRVR